MSLNQIDPDRRLWMYDGMGNKVYKGSYNQPYDGIDLEKLLVSSWKSAVN